MLLILWLTEMSNSVLGGPAEVVVMSFSSSVMFSAHSFRRSSGSWGMSALCIFPYFCLVVGFYRAMHFSAKRGIAIACRLSVRPSVCDVGEL